MNQSHTHYTVELRNEDGLFMTQSECFPVSYHHRSRDLAVLHLEDEEATIKMFEDLDFLVPELLLPSNQSEFEPAAIGNAQTFSMNNSKKPTSESLYSFLRNSDASSASHNGKANGSKSVGTRLEFIGHDVNDSNDGTEGDVRRCVPLSTFGSVHGRTQAQIFCQTSRPLTEGMCGGPVLAHIPMPKSNDNSLSTAGGVAIAGMVEGIVPLDYADKSMRGLAVFVESPIINEFLEQIEQGPLVSGVEPLVGGESVEFIATTQHTPEFVMPEV